MLATLLVAAATSSMANAHCGTCQQTVAYAPVAVEQTVAYQQPSGWYPGRMFDRMRMNRWFRRSQPATTYAATTTAAYSPYAANYAPYTASYAPATTVTTSYAPYVTAYAPLQRTVVARPAVQTSYYRPVVMRPVVAASVIADCGCSTPTCCEASPCDSCASGVSQAIYSDSGSGCSSCDAASTTSSFTDSYPSASQGHSGPPTPTPALKPETPSASDRQQEWEAGYRAGLEAAREDANGSGGQDSSLLDDSPVDPGPADEGGVDQESETSSSYPGYPKLFVPSNDRTARRRPTVDVHQAVYRRTAGATQVSRSVPAKSQAEIDAEGWQPVSR